jgi:hypothetical protein
LRGNRRYASAGVVAAPLAPVRRSVRAGGDRPPGTSRGAGAGVRKLPGGANPAPL